MKKSFILILMAVSAACTVKLIPPTQSDIDRVSTKYPSYNLTELNEGKVLFEQTCNRCHRLKNPISRNEDKWTKIVPSMIKKLNKKENKVIIDDKQQESILRYIITMNSAGKSTK
jgi:cytochrome c5